jgi:predicted nucleotidyltransferase
LKEKESIVNELNDNNEKDATLQYDALRSYLEEHTWQQFNELIEEEDKTAEKIVADFIKQYVLFRRMPLIVYKENENYIPPHTLDFNAKPLSLIHPLKRAAVEEILLSDIPDTVEQIIIFGSAVRIDCRSTSDIDIAIIGSYKLHDEDNHPWLKTLRNLGPKDIKTYTKSQLEENVGIRKRINEQGVVIYKQADR